MTELATTAFGAVWTDPSRTSAVLRATAHALGVDARTADELDLAAAAVGAHTLLTALGVQKLADVPRAGAGAAAALAAVLARAAGAAGPPPTADSVTAALLAAPAGAQPPAVLLSHLEQLWSWAARYAPDPAGVLLRAASDLAAGATNARIAAAADVLTTLAETRS